ncbi:hypothetical protein TspCOW1_09890 [Thiohalobacter sp. COW1]|nr:hypothetical protein TspCOW1_09890 [Thiohalobacter sp. COW1]
MTPDADLHLGTFIDSAVSGLGFISPSGNGLTDDDGQFSYAAGETVRFAVGEVVLGEARGAAVLNPLDLVPDSGGINDPRVLAIASFLQTADSDANPDNGIQVHAPLAGRLCDELGVEELELAQLEDPVAFAQALQAAAAAEGLSYVDPATAGVHLSASLTTLMAHDSAFNPNWGTAGVFTGAQRCAQCHEARAGEAPLRLPAGDPQGEDISPFTDWRHSMMAHSFDDPYFQAVLQEEAEHEFPAFAGLIEDRCLTCHTPMGRSHARKTDTGLDPDGLYRLSQARSDPHAREGVSCTLCHQVRATAVDTQGQPVVGADAFSGNYQIGDSRIIYGPFDNVRQAPMQNQVNYTPQYGHQMTDSGHCATCHTVRTPVMDVETGAPAEPAREFLEQSPYQEWENSVFRRDAASRRECQDCHMPPPDNYETAIATRPTNLDERSPYYRHRFFGGNTHMLEMLLAFREVLGIEGSTSVAGFEDKIAATRAFLQQESLSATIARMEDVAGTLVLDVELVNLSGHKLPTAYPSRRMWLHVTVEDGNGDVIFESGRPGADGRLAIDAEATGAECQAVIKPAGFSNAGCFEPHRDVITDPAQVAVYEAVLGDTNGHVNHVLLYADRLLKDNRLPPRGFRRSEAAAGTEIILGGISDSDFNLEDAAGGSGADTVHYRIPLGTTTGPYTAQVRVLYQSIRPSFVAGLHGDGDRVERFRTMYRMRPPPVEALADMEQQLP